MAGDPASRGKENQSKRRASPYLSRVGALRIPLEIQDWPRPCPSRQIPPRFRPARSRGPNEPECKSRRNEEQQNTEQVWQFRSIAAKRQRSPDPVVIRRSRGGRETGLGKRHRLIPSCFFWSSSYLRESNRFRRKAVALRRAQMDTRNAYRPGSRPRGLATETRN